MRGSAHGVAGSGRCPAYSQGLHQGGARARHRAEEVHKALKPSEQVVKIIHEELVEMLGEPGRLSYSGSSKTACDHAGWAARIGQNDQRRQAGATLAFGRSQALDDRRRYLPSCCG